MPFGVPLPLRPRTLELPTSELPLSLCGSRGRRSHRLLLSNYDLGSHLASGSVQLGLDFASATPSSSPAPKWAKTFSRPSTFTSRTTTPLPPRSAPKSPTYAPPSTSPAPIFTHLPDPSRPLHQLPDGLPPHSPRNPLGRRRRQLPFLQRLDLLGIRSLPQPLAQARHPPKVARPPPTKPS